MWQKVEQKQKKVHEMSLQHHTINSLSQYIQNLEALMSLSINVHC